MLTSLAVALGGIALAYRMYYRESLRPETFSEALGGLPYRAVLNKYWVDELYDLVLVRGTLLLCRAAAWFDLHVIDGLVNLSAALVRGWSWLSGLFDLWVVDGAVNAAGYVTLGTSYTSVGFDTYVVDGLVNLTGYTVRGASWVFRKFQTGVVQSYATAVVLGIFILVSVYLLTQGH